MNTISIAYRHLLISLIKHSIDILNFDLKLNLKIEKSCILHNYININLSMCYCFKACYS